MSNVQFVFDCILSEIFHDWCPSGHLIRMLGDAFFTSHLILLLSVALNELNESKNHLVRQTSYFNPLIVYDLHQQWC